MFLGPYSSESCGDYASGTNHTLPTYGYARMYSGVSTASFQKHITAQVVSKEGLANIGPACGDTCSCGEVGCPSQCSTNKAGSNELLIIHVRLRRIEITVQFFKLRERTVERFKGAIRGVATCTHGRTCVPEKMLKKVNSGFICSTCA